VNHIDIFVSGEPQSERKDCGESSITIYSDEENGAFDIAQNNLSYWVTSHTFNLTVFLHNTSEAHTRLNVLLGSRNNALINAFVDKLILQHITPERIRQAVTRAAEKAYGKGKAAARREIREALGIIDSKG